MSEPGPGRQTTLRRQLFRSHLLVMLVAVLILVAGAIVIAIAVNVANPDIGRDRTDSRSGPDGPVGLVMLIVVAGVATLAAGLVGVRMTRRLAGPIESIGRATRRIADGDYRVRVQPTAIDELDRLGIDVNELANSLDTTETQRLQLLGDVAHELRTPLTTIEGTIEALIDGVLPATQETFTSIANEASRMRRLTGDLSALSSATEPGDRLQLVDLHLRELVETVAETLRPQAEAKGLALVITGASEPGSDIVHADHDRMAQIVTNVIGNAIQYTERGTVTIDVSSRPPDTAEGSVTVVTTVTDTGRGLTEADQDKVFERFYRADQHLADGTGVGLTIARQLVQAHQGTIGVRSDGPGAGSTFEIVLDQAPSEPRSRPSRGVSPPDSSA